MDRKDNQKPSGIAEIVSREKIHSLGKGAGDLAIVVIPLRTAYIQFTADGLFSRQCPHYPLIEKLKIHALVAGTDALQAAGYVSLYFQYLS